MDYLALMTIKYYDEINSKPGEPIYQSRCLLHQVSSYADAAKVAEDYYGDTIISLTIELFDGTFVFPVEEYDRIKNIIEGDYF